jgi:hypothetical protein
VADEDEDVAEDAPAPKKARGKKTAAAKVEPESGSDVEEAPAPKKVPQKRYLSTKKKP